MRNKVVVAAIVLIAVFLIGFVPQYLRARRLIRELRDARQETAGAAIRDLAALAYVQANQKNYGLAAETSTRFFNRAREVANQMADPNRRKGLEDALTLRDRITAELAKGDPAVIGDLQDLFLKTRGATEAAGTP